MPSPGSGRHCSDSVNSLDSSGVLFSSSSRLTPATSLVMSFSRLIGFGFPSDWLRNGKATGSRVRQLDDRAVLVLPPRVPRHEDARQRFLSVRVRTLPLITGPVAETTVQCQDGATSRQPDQVAQ